MPGWSRSNASYKYINSMSKEGTEEVASLTVEVGVGNQSSSAEVVLDNKDDDVILEVSCSQAQSQLLVELNEEAEAVVSSEDVGSLLWKKSSQNQALLVTKLELEEGVLETVSSQGHDAEQSWPKFATDNSNSKTQARFIFSFQFLIAGLILKENLTN